MPDDTKLSPVGALVRRADPDRFLTALFAPPEAREALFTLYAFNNELARAREVVREPMLAMIRLQWWREVVEGAPRAHEVATPLRALLQAGRLDRGELLGCIEAREAEVDTVPSHDEWRAAMLAGPGGLALAAGRLLGAPAAAGLRELGAAYGVAGALRNVAALARAGRCLLPEDLLAQQAPAWRKRPPPRPVRRRWPSWHACPKTDTPGWPTAGVRACHAAPCLPRWSPCLPAGTWAAPRRPGPAGWATAWPSWPPP